MDLWNVLLDIVVLLGACLIVGGIFARLGQSSLVGYLLAGMVLGGPGSLDAVKSESEIEAIAELGVSLLLFSLGLEFSVRRLRSLGWKTLLGGAVQVVLTAILGAMLAFVFRWPTREAIAIGAMISLSSTACVLRVLMERAETDSVHGRNCVAILLVQDIAVVPLAVLMTLLAGGGTPTEMAMNVGRIVGLSAALILGLYVLLEFVAARVLGSLTFHRNRELTILLAVVTGLGATWAAHAAGISPALGAFVAGMFLGSSPFATQVRADVSSLRVILLTLFFGAAGMVADPLWIARNAFLVLGATAGLIAMKSVIIWGVLRAIGLPTRVSLATGICLSQIGEFAFVLGAIGHAGGVISTDTHLLVVSATIMSLFVSPYLVGSAPVVAAWVAGFSPWGRGLSRKPDDDAEHAVRDVVFIGYGPTGWLASQVFAREPHRVLVIDFGSAARTRARELGFRSEVGDATQADVLEHFHLEHARLVVITVPDMSTSLQILHQVRAIAPNATTIVRSRYHVHKDQFRDAGADVVLGDEESVGQAMSDVLHDWKPLHVTPAVALSGDSPEHKQ